jgi:hypothetical protein
VKWTLALLAVVAFSGVVVSAFADTTGPCKAGPGVLCVGTIDIHGHDLRPMVVSDVSKATVKLPVTELRQPFVDRIEAATKREPF